MDFINKITRYFVGILFNFSAIIFIKRSIRKAKRLLGYLVGSNRESHIVFYDTKKVSIIVVVEHASKLVENTIDSALSQTYPDLEVIVVVDAMRYKDSMSAFMAYKSNSRFKLFEYKTTEGINSALNKAIIDCNGDWILTLRLGDVLNNDTVGKLMTALELNEEAIYAYATFSENEKPDSNNNSMSNELGNITFNTFFNQLPGESIALINKKVFLATGLFESRFDGVGGYDLALKAAFHFPDSRFVILEEKLFKTIANDEQTKNRQGGHDRQIDTIIKEALLRAALRQGRHDKFVSFIVLSYEKKEMTLTCVEAIKSYVRIPHEIIVFDNGSIDETKAFIKFNIECIPDVKVIYSDKNLGLGQSRHEAFTIAKGDYIVNVDNDIFVRDFWIEELIVKAQSDEKIMAVTSKTSFPDGKLQFNGGAFTIHDGFIKFRLLGSGLQETEVKSALWQRCDWVPGGSTLFKREVLDKLDFSPGYINAFEDLDMAFQIHQLGYTVVNCPSAKVLHNHIYFVDSKSKTEKRYIKARYNNEGLIRSFLNFYIRHNLILEDTYIFSLFSLNGKPYEKIKAFVNELLIKYK